MPIGKVIRMNKTELFHEIVWTGTEFYIQALLLLNTKIPSMKIYSVGYRFLFLKVKLCAS